MNAIKCIQVAPRSPEKQAKALLEGAGLGKADEGYNVFLELLTASLRRAFEHEREIRNIGTVIENVVLNAPQDEQRGHLLDLSRKLKERIVGADIDGVRLISLGARRQVTEARRQEGNQARKQSARNENIRAEFSRLVSSGKSQRAAAIAIRAKLNLSITPDRIRQIASKNTG